MPTLRDWLEIRDAIGDLCDGVEVEPELVTLARSALRGPVATLSGVKRFYADLDTLVLEHVDTAEGIWDAPADGVNRLQDGTACFDLADDEQVFDSAVFPLEAFWDRARFERIERAWLESADEERRLQWARFLERVVNPLRARLGES